MSKLRPGQIVIIRNGEDVLALFLLDAANTELLNKSRGHGPDVLQGVDPRTGIVWAFREFDIVSKT